MIKKTVRCAFCIFSLLSFFACGNVFLSCSNANQDTLLSDDSGTLRSTADSLYSATLWTEELELDRLNAKVSAVDGISSKLSLTPLIVAASVPAAGTEIFPQLGSFGSLDTTLIPKPLREMLTSFSDAISKNEDADRFFAKENLYSLALFYTDFFRIFSAPLDIDGFESQKKALTEQKNAETESTENPESISSETVAVGPPENVDDLRLFTQFVLGQPFLDGRYYDVPVLLTSEKASLTLSVYCFEEAGSWKIDQIQIADWELFDGGE